MIESVHCPECQTHYGLRRERVRYGLRRARCFRCEGIFSIEDEVNRILAAGLPKESAALPYLADTFSFSPAVVDMAQAEPPRIDSIHLDASAMEEVYQSRPEPEEAQLGSEDTFLMEPVGLAEVPEIMPDSLTLQDLEGAEEEILDKTLVDFRPPVTPMELPPMPEVPAEAAATAGGGYASARDAIDKLLGGMGAPTAPAVHQNARATGSMDVEATLSALDDTLGGNKIFQAPPTLPTPPELPVMDFDTSLLDVPGPLAVLKPEPAPATVRLTRDEIMAAMTPPPAPEGTLGMPIQRLPESHAELDSTLIMLTPPPAPVSHPAPVYAAAPTAFMPVEQSQDQNLYRVQAGTETIPNLTMETMMEMVGQGRLADYNMVARQFSENWIEAGKVPALRPIFERVRRERLATEPPPASMDPEAPKRSLFGGLFGRKDG